MCHPESKWFRQQLLLFYSEIIIVFILSYFFELLLLETIIPFAETQGLAQMLDEHTIIELRIQLLQSVLIGLGIAFLLCIVPVNIIGRSSVRVVLLGISERLNKGLGRKILLFVQMVILLFFCRQPYFKPIWELKDTKKRQYGNIRWLIISLISLN